ncbi:MAG: hypothetical protein JNN13_19070 [Planctomycetes bacterium]|nr:hypothetical protein [Planctomycetota bacterium]
MHATSVFRSLALLTAAGAVVAQGPAAPRGIESLLPASTYAVAQFGGLAACSDVATHLPLGRLVADFLAKVPQDVKAERLERGLEMAAQQVQQRLQHAGVRPADLRAMLARPMALAMGRLTIEGMGPSVALVIDQGNDGEAVQRVWVALVQMAVHLHEGLAVGNSTAGDVPVQTVTLPNGFSILAGTLGNCFVVTNSRGYLAEMAAVAAGQAKRLDRPGWVREAQDGAAAVPLAALAINLAGVNNSLRPHLPYEAEAWADAFGLGALDTIRVESVAGAHGGIDRCEVQLGGSKQGLLKAISGRPVELGFANACSKNTVLFGAETIDLAALLDAGQRCFDLLPLPAREEMKREIGRELRRELRHIGLTPAELERLLRAFGGSLGYALAIEPGALPKPELLLHLTVRDADTVGALLQRLEAMTTREARIEWKTRRVGDHDVRFCNVQPPGADLQFSPGYVLSGDSLWVASDTAALVRALRTDGDDCLATQPDFQQLAQASRGASSVLHVRWFRGVELGWRNVETLLYSLVDAHADEIGFGSDALPDQETLAKALGCSSLIYRVDDAGMRWEVRGPITLGTVLAGFGSLADQVLDRASGKVF